MDTGDHQRAVATATDIAVLQADVRNLTKNIEDLKERDAERHAVLEGRLDERHKTLVSRFEAAERHFDDLSQVTGERVGRLDTRVEGLDDKVEELNGKVSQLSVQQGKTDDKVDQVLLILGSMNEQKTKSGWLDSLNIPPKLQQALMTIIVGVVIALSARCGVDIKPSDIIAQQPQASAVDAAGASEPDAAPAVVP